MERGCGIWDGRPARREGEDGVGEVRRIRGKGEVRLTNSIQSFFIKND